MTTEEFIRFRLEQFLAEVKATDIPVIIQHPKDDKFGDFSSNMAMQLAKALRKNPMQIAGEIRKSFPDNNRFVSKIEIVPPGFINFYSSNANLFDELSVILRKDDQYGKSEIGNDKKAQVEFVSANPTGPLTIGHGRGAVLGDTISRLLEAIGYKVTREYYFNNAGRQMRVLANSVRYRYLELLGEPVEFPDDHYQGEYIRDIARELYEKHGAALKAETEMTVFKMQAEQTIFADIRKSIHRLGFDFDVFYNEQSLYDEGKIDEVIRQLRVRNLIEERDGATWFLTAKLGFEQDRVFIKSTGEPTYRLPDTAYHVEKIKRGFDLMIDIFGADHIATYPDVLAAVKALDYDTGKIKVLINQFVTLLEGDAKVKMSTRKANFVTLDELMDEVGVDVTRYFFLMRSMSSHLNFDLTLAKTQSDENPVFYIQYAHARICSILRLAAERKIDLDAAAELPRLSTDEELNLIKHLISFPAAVQNSALSYEPHRMVNYLSDLATLFHKFYTVCRVITDDEEVSRSRLKLILAVKIIIRNGLSILGISAPEKM